MDQRVHPGAGQVNGTPVSLDHLPAAGLTTTGDQTVELRLPANRSLLFLARLVADGVAAEFRGTGFGADAMADLRLAVDEAVATLAVRADEGAVLDCVFRRGDRITVTVATSSSAVLPPGPGELAWHMLRALTDSVATWSEPAHGDDGWRLCLEFTKEPGTGGS